MPCRRAPAHRLRWRAGYQPDTEATINSLQLTYEWFDHVMRGGPMPALLQDRINYEIMGAGRWEHAPSIDAMSREKRVLYLSDEGTGERHRLTPTRPKAPGFLDQSVDLADRGSQNNLYPGEDIGPLPEPGDGFLFTSDPFDAPVTLAGRITGKLDLSINRRDADVTPAAGELMPDGRAFWLMYHLGRASYARDMTRPHLLTPGRRTWIAFDRTQLVSRRLQKGSRLLLAVTINKNRFAQVNYGTGRDVSDESVADARGPLKVRWYTDSFVTVPLSP